MKIRELYQKQPSQSSITKLIPGKTATIKDKKTGTETELDLKKDPNALTKDPNTGEVTLNTKPLSGDDDKDPKNIIKPGDKVTTA